MHTYTRSELGLKVYVLVWITFWNSHQSIINQSINQGCLHYWRSSLGLATDLHTSAKNRCHYYLHHSFNSSHPLSTSRLSSFHHSNIHFLSVSVAIYVIQFTLPILLPSPYYVRCLPAPVAAWSLHFSFCPIYSLSILLITLLCCCFVLCCSTPHSRTTMRAPSWHRGILIWLIMLASSIATTLVFYEKPASKTWMTALMFAASISWL